ncbi:hypothetical protein GPECTOR_8g308 [Gonium pectorale]|uniref:Uncharacterized protein n=1 Tax=Gonium pectorale TaxID=33097 RepID=A0A150GT85_GONPE|nr:hypothetical protein GPECTOR_8g308 [Gonium pectorale]|eukprot:KXZ52932.1 hypothetical protein GPECTOR_8g308 [Gonium pectorale]
MFTNYATWSAALNGTSLCNRLPETTGRCNASLDTRVGDWSSGEREVTFTTTVPLLPNVLRDQIKYWYPAFDWDRVPVREVQRVTWRGEAGRGSAFLIASKPEVAEASIGSIVSTDLELEVTETSEPELQPPPTPPIGAAAESESEAAEAAGPGAGAGGPRLEVRYRVTCAANTKTWVGSCVPGIEEASVARALESMRAFLEHCRERLENGGK